MCVCGVELYKVSREIHVACSSQIALDDLVIAEVRKRSRRALLKMLMNGHAIPRDE